MEIQTDEVDVTQEVKATIATKNKRGTKGQFKKVKDPLNQRITIRLKQNEYNEIIRSAKTARLSHSDYARKRILGKKIVARSAAMECFSEITKAIAQLKKLGGLQKELFNNSEKGKQYADDTAENLRLIQMNLVESKKIFIKISNKIDSDN